MKRFSYKKELTIEDILKNLENFYKKLPETSGCLENINKENGCGGWCCKFQSPQVLNVEFINTWNFVLNNFSEEEVVELLEKSIRNYLSNEFSKGCVFWNKETKLCKIHVARPFNCYLYGITPKEEFTERYIRMKKEHKNELGAVIRQQCDLVSTVNCGMPTIEETEKLWKELIEIEKNIGVDENLIHDGDGGTYRTYHDYILIKLLPVNSLSDMTTLRLYGTMEEKEQFVCNFISSFKKAYIKNTKDGDSKQ